MPLEIDHVGWTIAVAATEEMIKGNLVQRCSRGVCGDMSANAVRKAVPFHDHRHRIPAGIALDPSLDLAIARIRQVMIHGNGIDVGRTDGARDGDARIPEARHKSFEQQRNLIGFTVAENGFDDELE